ncbi:MAG: hypothetical protein FWF50_00260 [Defluviitaleaceae bacterium]|nr:hypothetical protein [Defluviitaleaceae bacterium]
MTYKEQLFQMKLQLALIKAGKIEELKEILESQIKELSDDKGENKNDK